MNTIRFAVKIPALVCVSLGLVALLPGGLVRAAEDNNYGVHTIGGTTDESDRGGSVRVDVVVDMTDAGKKIERPTPDRPAYYLPIYSGYQVHGYSPFFNRPPPSESEIENMLTPTLAQQGYQIMTHANHPSLVLYFWWGYMAPSAKDSQQYAQVRPGTSVGGANAQDLTSLAQGSAAAAVAAASDPEMRQLLLGESSSLDMNPIDPRKQEALAMRFDPRFYVTVKAYDFQSWLKVQKEEHGKKPGETFTDKPVLLWTARISTELWGHYFDQVVQTLVVAGGPWLGRETPGPQLATDSVNPNGRVILGTPEVKDLPTKP